MSNTECPMCRGSGYFGATGRKCPKCKGTGLEIKQDIFDKLEKRSYIRRVECCGSKSSRISHS